MVTEVIVPKLGQTMEEGLIVEWLKGEGDPVRSGEVLFTVESDKATLEVESPGRGFLRKILVPAGQTVPVITTVGLITRRADEDISAYEAPARAPTPTLAEPASMLAADPSTRVNSTRTLRPALSPVEVTSLSPPPPVAEAAVPTPGRVFSSPRARKTAREKGVDLTLVTGTGPNGRIVERDVIAYLQSLPKATPVAQRIAAQAGLDLRTIHGTGPSGRITKEDVEQALAPVPEVVPPPPPAIPVPPTPVEAVAEVPMAGVRAVIARRMQESHQTTAPVTLTTEADATAFVELRKRLKAKLAAELGFNVGYNDLLIKLVGQALREFLYMNARLEGDTIHHLDAVHVALAVDTDRGLLVPVIRDADRKGVAEIARDLRGLVERAREGKALPDELSGSTFTITNLGMHEIDAFTPIINLPEAAILGVGRIKARPAVVDGELCVRQMVWLSLTFDHRLVDGAPAAQFLKYVKDLIEDPYLWLMAQLR